MDPDIKPIEPMEPKAPHAHCDTCPLRDRPFVGGSGAENPRIVIVGEAPGRMEVKTGIPFIGKSGQLLNKVLKGNGIDRDKEVYVTNTVLCHPPTKPGQPGHNRAPTAVEVRHCKDRLIAEIKSKSPQVVMSLGAPASKAVLDTKEGITSLRVGGAKVGPLFPFPVIPTFHPAAILRDPSKMPSLQSDIAKAATVTVKVGWEPTKVKVVDDIEEARLELMRQATYAKPYMSLDIENAPTEEGVWDRHNPDMLIYSISHVAGSATVYTKRVVDDPSYQALLNSLYLDRNLYWLYQNGKYDIQYQWSNGIPNARVDEDTMLAHYATDERKGTHDLQQIATELLGAPRWKDEALKDEEDAKLAHKDLAKDVLYQYGGTDSDVTLRLLPVLQKNMQADGVTDVYHEILIPASDALAAMEYRGFPVDMVMIDELNEQLTGELSDKERELSKWVANPRSPQQVKAAFDEIMEGVELSNTNKQTLNTILEQAPDSEEGDLARAMLAYRKDHKTLTTYVRGMKKRAIHGRIHSKFNIHGTETGRLSSSSPNLQNITQGPLRGMFTADGEDHVLINADYAGIELRVASVEVPSAWLQEVWKTDRDLHSEVALELFGDTFTKLQRRQGKTVTFGIWYDRRAPAIAMELGISVRAAQKMVDSWKERAPEIDVYFARVQEEIKSNSYLRSHFGRVRRFWLLTDDNALDVFREGYNFKIQSWAGDINTKALIRLHREGIVHPVATVHDSISFDAPAIHAADQAQYIRRVMEDTSHLISVPTPVEMEMGYRWQ